MFQPWRVKLREIEAAIASNRLDEAKTLLGQDELNGYWPARQLSSQLAQRMAQRGRRRVQQGETLGGWHDLEAAGRLGADLDLVATLRRELLAKAVDEIEAYLSVGRLEMARARMDELHRRQVVTGSVRCLEEVLRQVELADRHAQAGQYQQAAEALAGAGVLRPDLTSLEERRVEYSLKVDEVQRLASQLHDRLAAEDWHQVLVTAESLLSLAPAHRPARAARRRAWEAVGALWHDSKSGGPRSATVQSARKPAVTDENGPAQNARNDQHRFLLWVDAVGGYLVCTGDVVTLGQPVPGRAVDVPILADLSGQHARIHRAGEGYLLEAMRETRLDGRLVEGQVPLTSGQTVELGQGVRMRFIQPHPLSTTARLEFVSRHRTQPSADGVLLMAQSLILSAQTNAHVVCRDWTEAVVLQREGNQLYCCTPGEFEVDGAPCQHRAPLHGSSHASGEEFSLSLEPLV